MICLGAIHGWFESAASPAVVCALVACVACGTSIETTTTDLTFPLTSSLDCPDGTSPVMGAKLFVSGGLPTCNLSVDGGNASGTCPNIPTGIDRNLVLRYSGADDSPIRYAVTIVNLTASELKGNTGTVAVTFVNDNRTGFFVDTDADVAQLAISLYGGIETALTGAQCFARSVIAVDANNQDVAADCLTHEDLPSVFDSDGDGCTNQRETCDGTFPFNANSHACN